MTRILGARWAFAVGAALVCACSTASTVSTGPTTTWVQVWSDEFDGAAGARIDSTKWSYETADGCTQGICGWGNNEKEYYSDASENIALNGQGQLMIVARRAPAGLTCSYGPCLYTSARITTRGKMVVAPGRVEARIKLPAGQGLWPAFWMLGHNSPAMPWPACGELDIMENKGSQPATTSSAVHGPGYSGRRHSPTRIVSPVAPSRMTSTHLRSNGTHSPFDSSSMIRFTTLSRATLWSTMANRYSTNRSS